MLAGGAGWGRRANPDPTKKMPGLWGPGIGVSDGSGYGLLGHRGGSSETWLSKLCMARRTRRSKPRPPRLLGGGMAGPLATRRESAVAAPGGLRLFPWAELVAGARALPAMAATSILARTFFMIALLCGSARGGGIAMRVGAAPEGTGLQIGLRSEAGEFVAVSGGQDAGWGSKFERVRKTATGL